jgi:hypothetical protein
MSQKKIIFSLVIFFLIVLSNITYAQLIEDNTLNVQQLTKPDLLKTNSFYISKDCDKEINFNIYSNYKKLDLSSRKDPKLVVNLVEFNKTNSLKAQVSINKLSFYNTINTNLKLNIKTRNFVNKTINLKIEFLIYDEYDNILDKDNIYLRFISNNSDMYYLDNKTHKVPILESYSLERDFLILRNENDFDNIKIEYNYPNTMSSLDLKCELDNNLNYKITYPEKEVLDLNVFVKDNKILKKDIYLINCSLFDSFGTYKLKPIYLENKNLNYIEDIKDYNILDTNSIKEKIELKDVNKENTNSSKLTSFINLKKIDFDIRIVFLIIIIFSLFLISISDKLDK